MNFSMGFKKSLFIACIFVVALAHAQLASKWYNFPDSIIHSQPEGNLNLISQGLSISGYYQLSLQYEDKGQGKSTWTLPPGASSWERENSLDQISRLAKDARVVLINEGHNLAQNRAFILRVLQELRL